MSQVDYIKHVLYTPEEYIRRFDFDFTEATEQGKRVALVALPFIAMYKPIGNVLSLGMGSCRLISHLGQAIKHEENREWKEFSIHLGHTTLAVLSLSATFFNFTLGLFVTTSFDIAHATYLSACYYQEGEYRKALEELLQVSGSCFYLGFMSFGSLELIMISMFIQAAICLYQAEGEISDGKYLEATGKIAMAMIRVQQGNHYRGLIARRNAIFAMQRYKSLVNRALKGRQVRHLVSSPLENLNGQIEEKNVVLGNQDGEFDFGSHFHGYGKGLVKGANLTFKQVVVNGKEMTELEFKVNHAFREHLEQSITEMAKLKPKELREILQLSGSHVEHITSETVVTGDFWDTKSTSRITLAGLGAISVGASPDAVNSYDRVVIQMDANKTIYDLHEMIAFADLDTALCTSTQDDINRLKMGHLFRTFFPSSALPFERTEEFFSLSTNDLKALMFEKEPEMERVYDKYFDRMTQAEILPGRVRYRIEGLADEVRALGGIALTSAVTGRDYTDEAFHKRIESLLTMGMLSAETRANNGIDYSGLSNNDWTGGADSVYTQMITERNVEDQMSFDQVYSGRARLVISLDVLETGTYQYLTGPMGNRLPDSDLWWWNETYFDHPNILEFTQQVQTKDTSEWGWEYFRNEVMIKERLDPSYIKGIILENEEDKKDLLKHLRTCDLVKKDSLGNETILGHAIDTFFRIGDHVTEALFT